MKQKNPAVGRFAMRRVIHNYIRQGSEIALLLALVMAPNERSPYLLLAISRSPSKRPSALTKGGSIGRGATEEHAHTSAGTPYAATAATERYV